SKSAGLKPGATKIFKPRAQARLPVLLVGRLLLRLLALHQFNVQAERLQLANENVERFRHARLDARFALDDGLVNLGTAINVVGLRSEQVLQDVRGAVGFERPDFHFAEALAAELRLAAKRLLRDERVRADAARVNLVVDKVRELEHVDVADRNRLIEHVSRHAVEQIDLSGMRQARNFEQMADFRLARAVEHGRGERNSFAEAFGDFEQLIVVELGDGFVNRGFGEDFFEPAANGFGANFLAEEALQAVAKFLASPAEVRFEN